MEEDNEKGTNVPSAKLPESRKSDKDIYNLDEVFDKGKGSAVTVPEKNLFNLDEKFEQNDATFQANKAYFQRADQYSKEAEDRTRDKLIGGFNFNYEYMPGPNNYIQEDLHEQQAQLQPGFDKFKRGLARFGGEFVLNVLETPGVLGGAAAAAVTGDINKMTDNFWVNATETMKHYIGESNPVYSSARVREGGIWDKMSSGEWLATEGASALAFMASALVPGLAVSKGAKALKLTQLASKGSPGAVKAMKAIDKAAAQIAKVTGGTMDEALKVTGKATGDLATHIGTTLTNTIFESGIEGMGAQKAFQARVDQEFAEGKITSEERQQLLLQSNDVAAKVFRSNMMLLTVPNARMTSLMLGPSAHSLSKAHQQIRRVNGKWVKGAEELTDARGKFWKAFNSAPAKAVGKMATGFAKNTASEGLVEEMGQMAIESYYGDEYLDALLSGEDKRNFVDTYARVLGSTDGQVAALTGGIISGPMSMYSRYREGKQLRKDVEELVNNYNGVDNYYSAARGDFYERDENGDIKYERVDDKGKPVETGGTLQPKVDPIKIAELGDAKQQVDVLTEVRDRFLKEGKEDEAAMISARLQSQVFGAYLRTGPDGLKALEQMMLESEATKFAVNDLNKKNNTEITVQEFVSNEMEKAKEVAKDIEYYSRNISSPLTRKWEKENKFDVTSDEGATALVDRNIFEVNYAQHYSEARAVEREAESRLKAAEDELSKMVQDDREEAIIANQQADIINLKKLVDKSKTTRKNLAKNSTFEKEWNKFYKNKKRMRAINNGEMIYELDNVIQDIKKATTNEEVTKVVERAIDQGFILPGVSKDKLPQEVIDMAKGKGTNTEVFGAIKILMESAKSQEERQSLADKYSREMMSRAIKESGLTEEEQQEALDRLKEYEESLTKETDEITGETAETDKIWEEFVANGTVPAAEIERIATKVANGEKLTQKEEAMRQEVSEQIEKLLTEKLQKVTPAEVKPSETTKEVSKEFELVSKIQVNRPATPASTDKTFYWLTADYPLNDYYNKLIELVTKVKENNHTDADLEHLYIALRHNSKLATPLNQIAPNFSRKITKKIGAVASKKWEDYFNAVVVTDESLTKDVIDKIDQGFDVEQGIKNSLYELILDQKDKIDAAERKAQIQDFNEVLAEKQRLWSDLRVGDSLVKAGNTVYWTGVNGGSLSGTIKSIIKTSDKNGTNVLVEDTNGKLYVVSAAALNKETTNTAEENKSAVEGHTKVQDSNKKSVYNREGNSLRVEVQSNSHPNVVSKGEVDTVDPNDKTKTIKVYNAFLTYLEEARDKSKDEVTFALQQDKLDSLIRAAAPSQVRGPGNPEMHKKLTEVKRVFEKAKNGEQLSTSEVDLLIDYMPMSLRAHRGKASDKNGSAGTEIPGDRGTDTNEEFNKYSRPIRAKIIQEWILSGAELDKKNNMIGISAKWDHVKTGVLNKEDGGEGSNKVHNLRGVTLENMKLFTVGSKVSNQIIHKNGDRTIVPIKLRDKTGGIFIEVKDNNGKPFNLRLKTNTLQGTPELDIIMDLIKEIMLGGRMDQIVPSNIMEKLENEIPLLAKVFKKTPTMGVLYNTLVYQGSDTSQVGVALNPATREFSIGPDTWSGEEFLDNIDTIKSMMGLKFRNVNFPSSDIKNNKVPSIANMDYLTYIMETKAVSTEIKENAPIFVGELEETINSNGEKVSNYMSNINPYLTPSNISGTKKVTPAVKKVTTKVVGEAVSLGSRARQKLEKAGYDPAKLSQKAIEFIKSIASKSSKAFIQAIEDYNNTIERESGNTEDHIIKKCRG